MKSNNDTDIYDYNKFYEFHIRINDLQIHTTSKTYQISMSRLNCL